MIPASSLRRSTVRRVLILHIFQVVGNWATGTPTNPYDIHEILVAYQLLDPGYELKV